VPTPKAALFLAGHTYRRYRRQRGTKLNVLPDFFISAHATVTGAALLTRDARHVTRHFPSVPLLIP
jgi:predicted nucleic acid-binding protein